MSRIGSQPITLPAGVSVTNTDGEIAVVGPKGELSMALHRDMAVVVTDGVLTVSVDRNSKRASALWGTMRARIDNMVTGVFEGWQKQLELQGVGYRAALKGKNLELQLGYSHPIVVEASDDISFAVEKEIITISGADKVKVGQVAAKIRALRKPEPYKGKGVRYVGEHVRRKVGKVVGSTS